MSSLPNTLIEDNIDLNQLIGEASRYVSDAARTGIAAHDVEKQVFDYVLKIGHQMLGSFFQLQGDVNLGATLTMPDGQTLKRQEARTRTYRSILGERVSGKSLPAARPLESCSKKHLCFTVNIHFVAI